MIEFLDALARHFRRHKMKYVLGLLATATVTAAVLYSARDDESIAGNRTLKRSLADC